MFKPVIATLLITASVECAPFPVSNKTQAEINHLIGPDDSQVYTRLFEKICEVKATLKPELSAQRDCDLLALQTALSFGKTGPDIVQQLRQSATQQWNKQHTSPVVQKAVLKMLTYGIRPTNGYAIHQFERDYLYDLSFEERTKAKQEFEQTLASFWPNLTKQLEREWLKNLPKYESIDGAAFEAGLDHEAALDIYTALLGHQIFGWIVSGFGGEESTFNEIPMPPEFDLMLAPPNRSTRKEWLKMLYTEASQLENKWHYRINDRDYHSAQPSYFPINEIQQYQSDASKMAKAYRHLPSDIRPEIVVMSANEYTANLPKTIGQVYTFSPEADHSLLGVTERLFNQDILADQRRFVGIKLGRQFYHQIENVSNHLGMILLMDSEEVVGFRRAYIPERSAFLHVATIRNTPELATLITKHEEQSINTLPSEKIIAWSNSPCNVAWVNNPSETLAAIGNTQHLPHPISEKAEIKTVADLANYITVIDNTLLSSKYSRKKIADLRHQFVMLSFHPKAEDVNFNINPEFRAALEKILNGPVLNEFQAALLEDHLMRLEQLSDRQIGYDMEIIAHSTFHRERFLTEVWPNLVPSHVAELPTGIYSKEDPYYQAYATIRKFMADGQRVFRRLQQLEIDVMSQSRESGKTPGIVLQEVLFQWENENGIKIDNHRLQWNLVMREIKAHPEQYGNLTAGNLFTKLEDADLKKHLFDVQQMANFSNPDCVTRVVNDYVPGLVNIDQYK